MNQSNQASVFKGVNRHPDGSRRLYVGDGLLLGEFHLGPGSGQWDRLNSIGDGHHVVFPGTAVQIHQSGRPAVIADPNVAVLYEPFQEYTRALVSPDGDHCRFVIVDPELLSEMTGRDTPRFDEPSRRVPPRAYLLARLASRAAIRRADRLLIEEAIIGAVGAVLGAPAASCTYAAVDEVKALLAVRYAEDLTLADIGRAVHVSPFHLARRFRSQTGTTIHSWREQVRLRMSLSLLEAGAPLAEVAAGCGFASHAHLTTRFRRTFGVPPSAVRDAVRDSRHLSTFLKAPSLAAL